MSDVKTYIGALLTNVEWDFNLNKIINFLTSGTWDIAINSWTATSNCNMLNSRITNVGTPTAAGDAVNKSYVDSSAVPYGYLWGFTLTKNGTTPYTDLDITQGMGQSSTNTQVIRTSTTFTKRMSTAWAAGTGNGALDTGTFAASTTYYLFVIAKTDGTTDFLASTSSTNPLLPTGYTVFRRVGIFTTDGSTHIQITHTTSVGTQYKYDFANPISKTMSSTLHDYVYTAECNGVVCYQEGSVNTTYSAYIYVDGVRYQAYGFSNTGSISAGNLCLPVAKGQTYEFYNNQGTTMNGYFIPQIAL